MSSSVRHGRNRDRTHLFAAAVGTRSPVSVRVYASSAAAVEFGDLARLEKEKSRKEQRYGCQGREEQAGVMQGRTMM